MYKGYKFQQSPCPFCGEVIAENHYIPHLKANHPIDDQGDATFASLPKGERPLQKRIEEIRECDSCGIQIVRSPSQFKGKKTFCTQCWEQCPRPDVQEKLDVIFDFIIKYKASNDGLSPTIREIMKATFISSSSLVHRYLHLLEEQGKIDLRFNKHGIVVQGGRWSFNSKEA